MTPDSPGQQTGTDAATDPIPLPEGWSVTPADDLRTKSGGRILIGGAPLKIIRLSATGARLSRAWFGGEPVAPDPAHQRLARRLVDAGMAHPRPADGTVDRVGSITVVIPVKDDAPGLATTLANLLPPPDVVPPTDEPPILVIVVDDGSRRPVDLDDERVVVHRNPLAEGPAGARQRAMPLITTDLVAFVDAGVIVDRADLNRLAAVLDDPALVAVAPRVLCGTQDNLVGRYDSRRSPLDLGPAPSLVGPGRAVPYVPSACLVARRTAIEAIGGFDPDLRYGEDVDLIWRLGRDGTVRYVPEVTAVHPPRRNLGRMIRQRRGYGSAAGPLAVRHGDAVAPCNLSPWSAAVTGLFVTGHPVAGFGLAAWTGLALRRKIEPLPDLTAEAMSLTMRGHWFAGRSVLTALARTWSPAAVLHLVLFERHRRRIATLLVAAFARRVLDGPRQPVAAALDVTVGAVDDLAYATGVWDGVRRTRSIRALLPAMTSWPKPADRRAPTER
ncbi:MAG: mycofactocin biosynthesis glycosyltransferase MftF [Actinomycetota bacterium]